MLIKINELNLGVGFIIVWVHTAFTSGWNNETKCKKLIVYGKLLLVIRVGPVHWERKQLDFQIFIGHGHTLKPFCRSCRLYYFIVQCQWNLLLIWIEFSNGLNGGWNSALMPGGNVLLQLRLCFAIVVF